MGLCCHDDRKEKKTGKKQSKSLESSYQPDLWKEIKAHITNERILPVTESSSSKSITLYTCMHTNHSIPYEHVVIYGCDDN